MIYLKYWLAFFFSLFAIGSYAQELEASFSCDDFDIEVGETKIINVCMTSREENIYGFQVRITIPDELSFAPVSGTGSRAKFATLNTDRGSSEDGFSITTTKNMADIKSAVFLSTSTEGYNYYGTSGIMFFFAVTASADITMGSHNIKFSEMEITKDINVPINPSDFEIAAKVLPTAVILNMSEISIMEGNSATLTAKLLPGEVAAGADVTWTSSDENVSTVSNGVVTAVVVGEAVITVTTSNGKTATCKVMVTEDVDKTANQFRTDNAEILDKSIDDVTVDDKDIIDKALEDYNALSEAAKEKLQAEKSDLDSKKEKVDAIITALSSVSVSEGNVKYFNLIGRRTSKTIKNGKKMFVK